MEQGAIDAIIETLKESGLADWSQMPDIDLYMDQVVTYLKRQLKTFTDHPQGNLITSSIVNNYVKAGVVPRPEKKKYGRTQLSALLMAGFLKGVMPMQSIKTLVMRDGKSPDEEYYTSFVGELESVMSQEAEFLGELISGEEMDREQLFHYAMCFAMRANADRYIADRLLELLNQPENHG